MLLVFSRVVTAAECPLDKEECPLARAASRGMVHTEARLESVESKWKGICTVLPRNAVMTERIRKELHLEERTGQGGCLF